MIISLRGTNGAGKSTIVRNIMKDYSSTQEFWLPNKRKPAGYFCMNLETRCLFIAGHYEIANGGIDTLDLKQAYKLILTMHEFGCDILYEGQNLGDRISRVIDMHRAKLDIRVIFIDYPLDKCITAVNRRGHTIKDTTIKTIYKKCLGQQTQLSIAGVQYLKLPRAAAQKQIQEWLNPNANHQSS